MTFLWTGPVSNGRARTIKLDIRAHTGTPRGPAPSSPLDPSVEVLCRVEADLGDVPESELGRRRGVDGRWYYDLRCGIEAVFTPAQTLYTLIYNGKFFSEGHSCPFRGETKGFFGRRADWIGRRYNTVAAECV